jgi:drug/metabolite transporter (DMT)-like permease
LPATTATLIGFGAVALWSLLALFTTATEGVPPFQVTASAFLVGGVLATIIVAARGRLRHLSQPSGAYLLGVGGLFGYHALYFAALKLAPAAEANLVNYLWPLLIVLFAALLPGERLAPRHVAGALIGFAGVAVLAFGKGGLAFTPAAATGYALAALAALIWAGYSVLSRRFSRVPTDAVAAFCLLTALLALVCHLAFETTVWPLSATQMLALAGLGIGPTGAAFFLWDVGMKRGDIRLLGVASYAVPVLSTLLLVLTGAASASVALGIACVLIVIGALIAARR